MSEEQKKPQAQPKEPASRELPANSPERLTEDSLIASLVASEAPVEDKPKKKPEVSTEEAATRTDNKGHLDSEDESVAGEESESTDEEETEEPEGDEEETEEEDDGDEEEGAEEDEEPDEDPEEVVYTTPEGDEVTLEELKRGYLRQSDYTKKTQEIAQARQQAQTAFEALEQHNQTVAEHLSLALNIVEPQLAELAQTDWDSLASNDAYEYAEKRAQFDQAQARYQRLQEAAQMTIQQEQERAQIKRAEYLRKEQSKLQMAMPDLGDPKKGPALAKSIKEYALSMGLNEKEASNITDHRLVVMLNKARMYDELSQSSLSAAKKKISKSPKKVARAGQTSSKAEINQHRKTEQRQRLKKTGSVDDAVAFLMS